MYIDDFIYTRSSEDMMQNFKVGIIHADIWNEWLEFNILFSWNYNRPRKIKYLSAVEKVIWRSTKKIQNDQLQISYNYTCYK